jgi:hypothetical protein
VLGEMRERVVGVDILCAVIITHSQVAAERPFNSLPLLLDLSRCTALRVYSGHV